MSAFVVGVNDPSVKMCTVWAWSGSVVVGVNSSAMVVCS